MAKRKKSGLGNLGNSWSPKKQRGRKKGMADVIGRATKKSGDRGGLGSGVVAIFDRKNNTKRRKPFADQLDAANLLKRRMTKTEYLEARDQAEQAVENDDTLRSKKTESEMVGQQGFFARLLAIIRRRM